MAEAMVAVRPNRAPTHPGAILREDVLPALSLPITTVARHLHVTRQQLHRVLSEEAGVSPEMALRLGKLCGNGPAVWLKMQVNYDLYQAQKKLGPELDEIPTLEAHEPA